MNTLHIGIAPVGEYSIWSNLIVSRFYAFLSPPNTLKWFFEVDLLVCLSVCLSVHLSIVLSCQETLNGLSSQFAIYWNTGALYWHSNVALNWETETNEALVNILYTQGSAISRLKTSFLDVSWFFQKWVYI